MGDGGIKSALQGSNVSKADEGVPGFVSGGMAIAGQRFVEGTLQAGPPAVSNKLLDWYEHGDKSAADKVKDAREYLAAALPELNSFFFFQAEDGIRDLTVTGVQTCALPI